MLDKIKRLTERENNGTAWPVWKDKSIPCCQKCLLDELWCVEGQCINTECDFRHIIDRLAAYEDSKMTPQEVIDMKERENKRRKRNKDKGKAIE